MYRINNLGKPKNNDWNIKLHFLGFFGENFSSILYLLKS